MGSCTNKVWGYNKGGYLYKVCDDCRVTVTLNEPGPKEQPPPALTPRADELPPLPLKPAATDPLLSDPLWREPF